MLLRPLLGYISLGLGAACLLLFAMYSLEKRGAQKWKGRAEYYHAELQRISTAKDEQRKETERRIAEAERQVRVVERVIRPLESKPIGENPKCETPDIDQWREVL